MALRCGWPRLSVALSCGWPRLPFCSQVNRRQQHATVCPKRAYLMPARLLASQLAGGIIRRRGGSPPLSLVWLPRRLLCDPPPSLPRIPHCSVPPFSLSYLTSHVLVPPPPPPPPHSERYNLRSPNFLLCTTPPPHPFAPASTGLPRMPPAHTSPRRLARCPCLPSTLPALPVLPPASPRPPSCVPSALLPRAARSPLPASSTHVFAHLCCCLLSTLPVPRAHCSSPASMARLLAAARCRVSLCERPP